MQAVGETSEWRTGQRVTMRPYTDCFGKEHPGVSGAIVAIRRIENKTIADYYRLQIKADNGVTYEASERMFMPV